MKLDFYDGGLYFEDMQFLLFPTNSFLTIINYLIEKYEGNEIRNLIHNATKIDSKIYFDKFRNIKTISLTQKLNQFINFLNSFGIGDIKLKIFSRNKIIIILENPVMKNTYKYTFKKNPEIFPEEIIVGFIKNYLELISDREVKAQIPFEKRNYIILNFDIGEKIIIDKLKLKNYNYVKKNKDVLNKIALNLVLEKHLKINSGILQLWGIYATIMPYFFLIELTKNLKEEDLVFFETLGRMQGKAAVNLQKVMFGVKKENLFEQILQQFVFLGMGEVELRQILPEVEFELKNNFKEHYSIFYRKKEYGFLKKYIIGDIIGVYESIYDSHVELIEEGEKYKLKIISKKYEINEYETQIYSFVNERVLVYKKRE